MTESKTYLCLQFWISVEIAILPLLNELKPYKQPEAHGVTIDHAG